MNALAPIPARPATPVDAADTAAPVRRFVAEHREGLWQAARLLGGYEAAREVDRLVEALASETSLSRPTCRRLQNLLDLLTLEHVHDSDGVEWGYFAVIDPADPCVEEICLLADGLASAVGSWRQAQRTVPQGRPNPLPTRRAA